MGKDLPEGSIIIKLGSVLLFRFGIEDVFRNVNEPVTELDLSVEEDDVLGMDLTVDKVFGV